MIYNICLMFFESVKLACVMNGFFNYKFKKSVVSLVLSIIYLASVIVLGVAFPKINLYADYSFVSFLSVLIVGFSLIGSYRIIASLLCYTAICGFDELILLLFTLIYPKANSLILIPQYNVLFDCISVFLLTLLAFIIQKTVHKKHKSSNYLVNRSNLPFVILFFIGEFVTFLCIAPFSDVLHELIGEKRIYPVVFVFVITFTVLGTGLILYYTASQRSYYKSLSDINLKLLESQADYYQMMIDKETETRSFRHDISNHLICLEQLLSESKINEAGEYVSSLVEKTNSLRNQIQTGNFLINVILTDLKRKYPTVNLSLNGLFPENVTLSHTDICTIFSNALENAFYAANECTGNKFVNIETKAAGLSLYVTITNSKSNKIKIKNGIPVTTKNDSHNHGFGITNIAFAVDKNNGSFDYKADEDVFTAEIVLPDIVKNT